MKLSAIIAPLIAAKVSHEVIMQTVQAWEAAQAEAVDEGKEKARARWRKWKANNPETNVGKRLQTVANVDKRLVRGDARVEDISSNLEITGKIENKEENARDARLPVSGFSEFWELFPNKVGKRDAEKAFAAALRRAPFEAIMAGLRRYVAKTDDRPWCNPATFLNQNRWEDQPAAVPPRHATAPPPDARPRNAGEAARQELIRRGQYPNATSNPPRLVDTSDGNSGFAGTGIARRIALAASGGRST